MNLKESFRYQKFLDNMMSLDAESINAYDHCLKTTRTHLMNKANPDAENRVEEVESERPFYPNDDVIRFMEWLVAEKQVLSNAIGDAKAHAGFDIDAAIEANKFRQRANNAIRNMLRRNGSKKIERGQSWKFNNEGVQSVYYYDVEVETVEAFSRDKSRNVMREMIREADQVSANIDAALINTIVDYEPVYDVNESFEDVMAEFVSG